MKTGVIISDGTWEQDHMVFSARKFAVSLRVSLKNQVLTVTALNANIAFFRFST